MQSFEPGEDWFWDFARSVALALLFPLLWTAWTMVFGAVDGWYPYPFLDPDEEGWGAVVVAIAGITAFFLVLFGAYAYADRRLPSTHERTSGN